MFYSQFLTANYRRSYEIPRDGLPRRKENSDGPLETATCTGATMTANKTPEKLGTRMWLGLVVLTLSTFIVVLDASVVFIAMPAILDDLDGSLTQATWVLAGFILIFAILLLPAGKAGDIVGRKRLCLAGIAVFTLASVACALAPTMEVLIAARIVQGVGAAMVEPTVLALIKRTFPAGKVGLAFGVQGVAAGVAASVGPTFGGFLTTAASWEWIFLINVPVGIVAIVGIALTLTDEPVGDVPRQMDWIGSLLSAAAIFALIFAIIEGEDRGWGSPLIIALFGSSAVFLALFILIERRVRYPLIDLNLFRDKMFSIGNVLRGSVEFITLGLFFPLALFIQIQLGYSALETGLIFLPLVLASFISSPLGGALSDRIDARLVLVPGLLLSALGVFLVARLESDTNWTFFILPLALLGLGLGSLYGTTVNVALRNVPNRQTGVASGVSYTAFLLGSELGIAIVGSTVNNRLSANLQDEAQRQGIPAEAFDDIDTQDIGLEPPEDPTGQFDAIFGAAFADAVNIALYICLGVAVFAAILALGIGRKQWPSQPEPESQPHVAP